MLTQLLTKTTSHKFPTQHYARFAQLKGEVDAARLNILSREGTADLPDDVQRQIRDVGVDQAGEEVKGKKNKGAKKHVKKGK